LSGWTFGSVRQSSKEEKSEAYQGALVESLVVTSCDDSGVDIAMGVGAQCKFTSTFGIRADFD
jgi:hypothetical protein